MKYRLLNVLPSLYICVKYTWNHSLDSLFSSHPKFSQVTSIVLKTNPMIGESNGNEPKVDTSKILRISYQEGTRSNGFKVDAVSRRKIGRNWFSNQW